jgi:hypothetical protein
MLFVSFHHPNTDQNCELRHKLNYFFITKRKKERKEGREVYVLKHDAGWKSKSRPLKT